MLEFQRGYGDRPHPGSGGGGGLVGEAISLYIKIPEIATQIPTYSACWNSNIELLTNLRGIEIPH
ncbi:hypothetical protein CH362_05245 [Leptospira saintgironsiae]|uniref:Uncharacterized protein n=1 Tax=Leptospira saintgironsiae TaxID=2023183 RepID=A0A2M9YDU6_9LEPT|nr:hypothetical protein CH362_05245 [Leptospira saintgironsiae]